MPTVQSVERAFAILDVVSGGASGVTDIAGRVDLPKSTVARMLSTLEDLGAVERVDGGSDYQIGPRLPQMCGPVDATLHLGAIVQPHLERLAMQLGESTGFGIASGSAVRVLTQVESPNAVQVRDYSGEVFPAHVGAPGVCLMAEWSERELDQYLSRPLAAYTEHTMVQPGQIRERLAQVRRDGFCWVHEEFADGISSVAALVRNPQGRALGAMHAHGPTYRFPVEGDKKWIADLVRQTAQQVLGAPSD
jgi:DNA-binding IclR family transcriptional regulator